MTRERLRRPEPMRTEPIRSVSDFFGRSEARGHDPDDSWPWGERYETRDDFAAAGVDLGYRVIEDPIRQERHAAQRTHERFYVLGASS